AGLPNSATRRAATTTSSTATNMPNSAQLSAATAPACGPAGSSGGGGQPRSASASVERVEVGGDIAGLGLGHRHGGHARLGGEGGGIAHPPGENLRAVGEAAANQRLPSEAVEGGAHPPLRPGHPWNHVAGAAAELLDHPAAARRVG